jgi:hypothetical protein
MHSDVILQPTILQGTLQREFKRARAQPSKLKPKLNGLMDQVQRLQEQRISLDTFQPPTVRHKLRRPAENASAWRPKAAASAFWTARRGLPHGKRHALLPLDGDDWRLVPMQNLLLTLQNLLLHSQNLLAQRVLIRAHRLLQRIWTPLRELLRDRLRVGHRSWPRGFRLRGGRWFCHRRYRCGPKRTG